jgi:hypothetical protein
MAGDHGFALATRFCQKSPQLSSMVAARTRRLDHAITDYLALSQGTRIFEVDFPTTLAERASRIEELGLCEGPSVERISVPFDLRSGPPSEALIDHLDGESPVFVVWEGMAMYFQEEEVSAILQGIRPLIAHPQGRLWVDLVDRHAVERPEDFPESVQAFMYGVQILGEPFTFGVDQAAAFLADHGLACMNTLTPASSSTTSRIRFISCTSFAWLPRCPLRSSASIRPKRSPSPARR